MASFRSCSLSQTQKGGQDWEKQRGWEVGRRPRPTARGRWGVAMAFKAPCEGGGGPEQWGARSSSGPPSQRSPPPRPSLWLHSSLAQERGAPFFLAPQCPHLTEAGSYAPRPGPLLLGPAAQAVCLL